MNEVTVPTYRLAEIEREARRLRAEAMLAGLSKIVSWFRKPRQSRAQVNARTA